MIGTLKGVLTHKDLQYIIIEANGIGYKVFTPLHTNESLNEKDEVKLWTHLAVRENSLDLYGFESEEELEFFEILITISGIGPRSALSILNVASIDDIKSAVSSEDTSYLTKVSGIGKKSAQRIVIELKDKLSISDDKTMPSDDVDVVEALKALGYSKTQSRDAVKKLDKSLNTREKIKEALKILGS